MSTSTRISGQNKIYDHKKSQLVSFLLQFFQSSNKINAVQQRNFSENIWKKIRSSKHNFSRKQREISDTSCFSVITEEGHLPAAKVEISGLKKIYTMNGINLKKWENFRQLVTDIKYFLSVIFSNT